MSTLPRAVASIVCVLSFTSPLCAQFTMQATNESGLPGDAVTASISMDNSQPARGFSFGLVHDASIVSLVGISQGAVVQATIGGVGADFFFIDTNPPGGPGGLVGCVVSLNAPIEEIPAGTNQEIALFDYSILGTAAPGSSSSLDFSAALGNPPVLIVISVSGTSMTPTTTPGSVDVLTPPIENLSCVLADPCTCAFDLSWTNPVAYDQISVFENGALVATLPGAATSTSVNLSGFGTFQLDLVPVAAGLAGPSTNCMATCPVIPAPNSPENLNCTVDQVLCEATATWTNPDLYASIEVSLDGLLVATLPGTDTTATVSLPGPGTFQICLNGTDAAGCVSFVEVCCSATCFPPFVRGDSNDDGVFDVSDPILTLGYAILGEPANCEAALDANDDEIVGIPDAIYQLDLVFQGGPVPPGPFPACGPDPTAGPLTCDLFDSCP